MRNVASATAIVATLLVSTALPTGAGAQSTGPDDMVGARAGLVNRAEQTGGMPGRAGRVGRFATSTHPLR